MLLNDLKVKNAKPKAKICKLNDGDGLCLIVKPNGTKLWHFRFKLNNKENVYSIGSYPETTLLEAREERFRLRKLVKTGIDPNLKKKEAKIEIKAKEEDSFLGIATEWYAKHSSRWTVKYSKKILTWLDNDIFPVIGHIQISELKPSDILAVVRKVEARGANDAARRILNTCSLILRYGIAIGKCLYDITIGISNALTPVKRRNFKCVNVQEFPALIKEIEQSKCRLLTKYALQLIALTFVRTTELRGAKWQEISFENNEWRIPEERMKMSLPHIVPLSTQSIKLLTSIRKLGYESDYIFPNESNPKKIMSENTMLYALYDIGYHNKMTVHGFRQLASTILNENGFSSDAIERQLSHTVGNSVRRAYNHAQYLPERREMMQWWADYISKFSHEW